MTQIHELLTLHISTEESCLTTTLSPSSACQIDFQDQFESNNNKRETTFSKQDDNEGRGKTTSSFSRQAKKMMCVKEEKKWK